MKLPTGADAKRTYFVSACTYKLDLSILLKI